jgi:hypothetical protein
VCPESNPRPLALRSFALPLSHALYIAFTYQPNKMIHMLLIAYYVYYVISRIMNLTLKSRPVDDTNQSKKMKDVIIIQMVDETNIVKFAL